MKKSSKKSSQNKRVGSPKSAAKPAGKPVGKRIVTALKRTLAQAMAPKAAKKPLTKKPAVTAAAKTPIKAPKAIAAKAAKPEAKLDKKAPKSAAGKPAPVPALAPASVGKKMKGTPPAPVGVPAKVLTGKAAKLGKPAKEPRDKSSLPKEKSAAAIRAAEAAGEKLCREAGCENIASTKGYCRLDYIKNWKKIKRKEMILKEGKLNQYIEELVSKYPDKYIDIIRQDLSTEVNFSKIIHDLELDESIDDLEYDGDSIDSLIGAISKSSDDIDDGDF